MRSSSRAAIAQPISSSVSGWRRQDERRGNRRIGHENPRGIDARQANRQIARGLRNGDDRRRAPQGFELPFHETVAIGPQQGKRRIDEIVRRRHLGTAHSRPTRVIRAVEQIRAPRRPIGGQAPDGMAAHPRRPGAVAGQHHVDVDAVGQGAQRFRPIARNAAEGIPAIHDPIDDEANHAERSSRFSVRRFRARTHAHLASMAKLTNTLRRRTWSIHLSSSRSRRQSASMNAQRS